MAEDTTGEMLDLMVGMEAQLVVMRQMLVLLTAYQFSRLDEPEQMLRAASEAMSKSMGLKEQTGASMSATERLKAEMDSFLSEVRRAIGTSDRPV